MTGPDNVVSLDTRPIEAERSIARTRAEVAGGDGGHRIDELL